MVFFSNAVQIRKIARHALIFREKLGEGEFGEVHLCDAQGLALPGNDQICRPVAVKCLRSNADEEAK